jgi:hypothetical protein
MSNLFGVVKLLHDVNKNMHIIFEIQNFKSQTCIGDQIKEELKCKK